MKAGSGVCPLTGVISKCPLVTYGTLPEGVTATQGRAWLLRSGVTCDPAGHWDSWNLVCEAPGILAEGGCEDGAEGQQGGVKTELSARRGRQATSLRLVPPTEDNVPSAHFIEGFWAAVGTEGSP